MSCIADTRDELREARRALLTHEAVAGAALTSPRDDPTDCWAIELSLLTGPASPADRLEPRHLETVACRGLAVHETTHRAPGEVRVC
jgi:hypothetical protein